MELSAILDELSKVQDYDQLKQFYSKYLGKKGLIPAEFKTLGSLDPEQKKEKGQFLSNIKQEIEKAYTNQEMKFKKQEIDKILNKETIDISAPGLNLDQGHFTLIAQTRRQMEEIFKSMGFAIEYGHDVVTKYENFYSLNIPATHPATEMRDTYYLDQAEQQGENLVLRTHTSAMQNLYMKKYGVPLKLVIPGKCYRYENTDASHDTIFWQLEGIVIDKDISIANFKNLIKEVLSAMFKTDVKIRMRPGYFPFVEPGFEIDSSCPICSGDGCKLCKKTGWIEILGAGMIHPFVLQEAEIDPDVYKGFAFGMGLTRLAAIKYGVKDIRLLTNSDLRFVQSF